MARMTPVASQSALITLSTLPLLMPGVRLLSPRLTLLSPLANSCAVGKKWLQFSVRFRKNCGFWFGFTKITAVSFFGSFFVYAIFHLRLYGVTLQMTYFCAELVQLIVSRSDLELEVQRHGMKKNILTVYPIMLEDELWIRQCEKPSPNRQSRFFENRTAETEFTVFEFRSRVQFGF